jgi:hypothetical protein
VVNNYGDAGGDAANAAKLKASLQIFYCLALAQNILILCVWGSLFLDTKGWRASAVSRQCGFGEKWGARLVMRYLRVTEKICATEGYVPEGRNLVSFAVTLLGSESLPDRRSALRLLDTFVSNKIPAVGPNLLPSKEGLENLMEALELGDGETRERAARVVGALAGDLRHIDQFPTALDHIASLLQAPQQRHGHAYDQFNTRTTSIQEDVVLRKPRMNGPVYWIALAYVSNLYVDEEDGEGHGFPPEQLISQGLLIIERLTVHPGNCAHICSNHGLLSRITAPLISHAAAFLPDAEYDTEWIGILSRSLRIVARLISAPGEACRELRNRIASETQAVANLTRILEGDKFGPALKAAAIEILAELLASSGNSAVASLGKGDINKFIRRMWGIFLAGMDGDNDTIEEEEDRDQEEATRLTTMREAAGGALARMLSVWDAASSSDILEMFIQDAGSGEELLHHVVGRLTGILITNRGSRTKAAEILSRLCSHFTGGHRELPRPVVIEMVTKVIPS